MPTDLARSRVAVPVWTAAAVCFMTFVTACTNGPTTPSASSSSAGQWSGTTSQGAAMAFTVSESEMVTSITIGHDFNSCSGSVTFSNLNLPTAPNVTCIPGPCSGTVSSSRAFGYSSSGPIGGPRTSVNGLFLPGNRADGQANFVNYPGCGTATGVTWSAARR